MTQRRDTSWRDRCRPLILGLWRRIRLGSAEAFLRLASVKSGLDGLIRGSLDTECDQGTRYSHVGRFSVAVEHRHDGMQIGMRIWHIRTSPGPEDSWVPLTASPSML